MAKRKQAPGQDDQDSALKRTKTEIITPQPDADVVMTTLTRQMSVLTAQAHADQPKVLLHPRVKVANDKIEQVIISRLKRTPSPFKGNRMGDHTVAWQAVIDSVHARLHGLTVPQAIQALTQRQQAVAAWMAVPDSEGRKLLRQLEDAAERRPLLENAAHQADQLLADAGQALGTQAIKHLESAIAWHLTYVNYLPFATVPAKSSRGSHGSAEGRHRAVILTEEKKGAPAADVTAGSKDGAAKLLGALWGMFAFEAALREARAELAIVPAVVKAIEIGHLDLTTLATACLAHAAVVLASEVKGRGKYADEWRAARRRGDPLPVPPIPALPLDTIETRAREYTAKDEEYKDVQELAGYIRDAASYFRGIGSAPYTSGVLNMAEGYRVKIGAALTRETTLKLEVAAKAQTAVPNAALILAHLVYDHQATVALAYPRAVIASGFLQPSAPEAAHARLEETIAEQYSSQDKEQVKALIDAFDECYQHCGDAPAPAVSNGWAAGSRTEELVANYTQGSPLTIDGRPKTPPGVAGMGSHTTAWVVECLAADALVSGARTAEGAIQALQDAVRADLAGPVIALDRLLPADQLDGDQMDEVFNAALKVLDAKTVQDAATGYLTFRNMLPYATVDAGDRGGHGEDVSASEDGTFDSESLREAAELEGEARENPERRQESSDALAGAADWLTGDGSNPKWATHPEITDAVAACVARLRAQANDQDAHPPAKDDIAGEIVSTRRDEHAKVYNESRKSSLAGRG